MRDLPVSRVWICCGDLGICFGKYFISRWKRDASREYPANGSSLRLCARIVDLFVCWRGPFPTSIAPLGVPWWKPFANAQSKMKINSSTRLIWSVREYLIKILSALQLCILTKLPLFMSKGKRGSTLPT